LRFTSKNSGAAHFRNLGPGWQTVSTPRGAAPPSSRKPDNMIRSAITAAACQAIAVTMPGCEPEAGDGERLIRLEPSVVNKLRFLRGPGESYSDVILRVAGERRS
jgi:hypothetical protein